MSRNEALRKILEEKINKKKKQESGSALLHEPVVVSNADFPTISVFVSLPSEGKFYPPEHPLHNKTEVEIISPTAKTYDILNNKSYAREGKTFDMLLRSILPDSLKSYAGSLLIGDRNAIVAQARIIGFGKEYRPEFTCPICERVASPTFDLEEAIRIETSDIPEGVQDNGDGTFDFELPYLDRDVALKVRLMTGDDQDMVAKLAINRVKQGIEPESILDALRLSIIEVDGSNDKDFVSNFIETMPLETLHFFDEVYKMLTPSLEFVSVFKHNCGYSKEVDIPIDANFFRRQRRGR